MKKGLSVKFLTVPDIYIDCSNTSFNKEVVINEVKILIDNSETIKYKEIETNNTLNDNEISIVITFLILILVIGFSTILLIIYGLAQQK